MNPIQLWAELKQRKVVRVITIYIAGAFAILQAVDMIFPRLGFPSWTITLVMILLAAGLVISIILSWIYDITPEGIKKTKDLEQIINEDIKSIVGKSISSPDEDLLTVENKLYAQKINQYKKKERVYRLSSLVVIIVVVIIFLFSSGSTLPFSERDWILITDFENLTENPVFDKSLYTAFTLSISQSKYVNVFPWDRMLETLTRMKIKDLNYVNDKTGREIAVREGINICIIPSISKVGNKYVITAKILETKTRNILKSELLYAETQDEILPKLDRLSKNVRRQLGESRYDILIQDKPLSKVTTSSLDALKLYSLGIDHHITLDYAGAKDYYESALRIDTGFTAAKASLGNLLIEKFDSLEKGRELLNLAVKSVDNLTERERLGILALHAVSIEKDLPKAIRYTKMRIDLYPDDPVAHNNLGWYYQSSGQLEEALKEYKATVGINKNMVLTYSGILWIYLEKLGKADSAVVWAEKMIADNPQNVWGYCNLGAAWLCLDSLDKAEVAFLEAREINPDLTVNLYRLAHTYRLKGAYDKAIGILKEILEKNPEEASAYYDSGINYQAMGNLVEARRLFSVFKKIAEEEWIKKWPDDAGTYAAISVVSARLNDMESSELMFRKAIEIDSTLHDRFAEVLCVQGKTNNAVDELEKALQNGYRNLFWIKLTPDLQMLQAEARYRSLMQRYFQ